MIHPYQNCNSRNDPCKAAVLFTEV